MASTPPPAVLRKKDSAKNGEQSTSRLRPRIKTDKPSQVAKCMEIQSSSIVAKKSEVPTIGQPSKDKSTKKSTESNPQSIEVHAAASSGISCLSLKDHGAETKGKEDLKNQHVKREASQPPQCGIKASSNSRKRQNEEPIASTLRPPFKTERVGGGINVNNPTVDKPSQVSKSMKNQSSSLVAKKSEVPTIGQPSKEKSTKKINDSKPQSIEVPTIGQPSKDKSTKKSNDSKPQRTEVHAVSSSRACLSLKVQGAETKGKQDLKNQHAPKREANASSSSRKKQDSKITKNQSSVTNKSKAYEPSSSNIRRGKEKIIPSLRQAKRPMNEDPIYYITCEGSEEMHTFWNCALCEGSMEYPSNDEQSEYLDSLLLHEIEELGPFFPEAAVLQCGHVFHSTCLPLELTELIDPPCPLCLSC
ncbi:uncharacterized protein LOC130723428 [Lotus japonicus]|uniref:uncharacterized protein LOC130723428 n=1 Tax=Lotus japonicus TaxID=34305 RepID=UPI00258BA921|nr:uncharacterized protein LOC130723428 [Lotus japonicus]